MVVSYFIRITHFFYFHVLKIVLGTLNMCLNIYCIGHWICAVIFYIALRHLICTLIFYITSLITDIVSSRSIHASLIRLLVSKPELAG